MDADQLWSHVATERARLLGILETLSPAQFETPSLCPGWRVRDVAAHVIAPTVLKRRQVPGALLKARGNFDAMNRHDAQQRGQAPIEQILDTYRRNMHSRRRAPGAFREVPLMDLMVHTQDIAIPLGIEHHMPPEAARECAALLWKVSFPFRARKRLGHLQLRATDIDWFAGSDGPMLEGPIEALLLLLSGRTAWLHRLSGPGLEHISSQR